jgi:hypothetical protein
MKDRIVYNYKEDQLKIMFYDEYSRGWWTQFDNLNYTFYFNLTEVKAAGYIIIDEDLNEKN